MENLNVVEILKIGLPGLVFLLSALSFKLLSQEQAKEHPRTNILNSIKLFMFINVLLAVLTLASPLIDNMLRPKSEIASVEPRQKSYVMKAKAGAADLNIGIAAVCQDADYINRYLLVQDKETGRLRQVFAKSIIPCHENKFITLSTDDVSKLGWGPETKSGEVHVVVSPPGFMFAITSL
jgi:hypothetical protein